MKERPILFKAEMVRAILEGRKTHTRRVLKCDLEISGVGSTEQWARGLANNDCFGRSITDSDIQRKSDQLKGRLHPVILESGRVVALTCPYGQVGDRIWVREYGNIAIDKSAFMYFDAGGKLSPTAPQGSESWAREWKSCPSIHMPRWASRISLEITDVRVERLNDISEQDAIAEGITVDRLPPIHGGFNCQGKYVAAFGEFDRCRYEFHKLWESINGAGSWEQNPWVWVIEFKRIEQ